MNARVLTFILVTVVSISVTSLFTGCAGKLAGKKTDENALVIPDFPTAENQFAFARMYQNSQLIAPELDRRRVQMQKIGECYQRVITNFPNDTTYVPRTLLELGDCAAQSDEMQMALDYYQQAQTRSQEDFVTARAMYSIARIYDTQKKYEDAKAIYKQIMEIYGKNENGRVRDVVTRAAQLYFKVQDTSGGEAPKKLN